MRRFISQRKKLNNYIEYKQFVNNFSTIRHNFLNLLGLINLKNLNLCVLCKKDRIFFHLLASINMNYLGKIFPYFLSYPIY